MTALRAIQRVDPSTFRASLDALAGQAPHAAAAEDIRSAGARVLARLEGAPLAPPEGQGAKRLALALQWMAQVSRKARKLEVAAVCLHEATELDRAPELSTLLFNVLEETGAWEDLVSALRGALATELVPERRRELFRRLGRAAEEGLRQYGDAARVFAAASQEFPDSARFLQDQARCLEAQRDFPALLAVVERQLALDTEPHRLALLHARAATLRETLGEPGRALEHYRAAMKLAPKLDTPFQGLLSLAEGRGDWTMVAELLKERLKVEARPRERATILYRLGELQAHALHDPEQACVFLERAVREHPRALHPRLLLLQLLCAQRQYARAERFATPPDVTDTQGLGAEELTRLCEFRALVANERGRPVEAVECLCLALSVAPDPDRPLSTLVALTHDERPEMPPPQALLDFAQRREAMGEPGRAAQALLAAAHLDVAWGKLARAEQSLRHALALTPEEPSLHRALAALYQTGRRHAEAAAVLQRAAAEIPFEAPRFTIEAARVLADHLGQFREAQALLAALRTAGRATPEAQVLEAGLAFAAGAFDEAGARLAAVRDLPLEGSAATAAARLELELVHREGVDNELCRRVQETSARAGAPRLLRTVLSERLQDGDIESLDDFVDTVAPAARTAALRIASDVLRQAGREEPARYYGLRALLADGSSMEVLESLALVAPDEAVPRLEALLEQTPYHARAAALLSSLLSALGDAPRAEALTHLAQALRGELTPARDTRLQTFLHLSATADPLLDALRTLRAGLAEAFDRDERALFAESRRAPLPATAQKLWEEAAAEVGAPLPEVRFSEAAHRTPIVLSQPFAVLLSPVLLHRDMPEGAMRVALLRALGAWQIGAGPLSYTSVYRLDVLGEALRLSERRAERAGAMLGEAFELPAETATAALTTAFPLAQGRKPDFVAVRAYHEERLLRAALLATGDLTGALAAASLHAPARLAPAAAGERWQRLLARIPAARSVLTSALSEPFAALFAPQTEGAR